jgi:hypothetical protein
MLSWQSSFLFSLLPDVLYPPTSTYTIFGRNSCSIHDAYDMGYGLLSFSLMFVIERELGRDII